MGEKYVIWHIEGGLGKNIAATSLIEDLSKSNLTRKLIVVCSFPEIFLNNPFIYRVFNINKLSYFYSDYIKNKDTKIFRHDCYYDEDFIKGKSHMIQSWCNILGIEYKNQYPKLYLNYAQIETNKKWLREKPILVLQTTGGPNVGVDNKPAENYNWVRDIHLEMGMYISQHFSKIFHIIHVTRPGGYILPNVERIDYQISCLELAALLKISTKRILIDSALQHIAASLEMKSDVFWIGTSPSVYGYANHNNIVAKPGKDNNQLISSYNIEYGLDSNLLECPYKDVRDMFDLETITTSLEY